MRDFCGISIFVPDSPDASSVARLMLFSRRSELSVKGSPAFKFRFWKHPDRFRLMNVAQSEDQSHHRWLVDTARDLEFVRAVYARLSPDGDRLFGMQEVLKLLDEEPDLVRLNSGQVRNEGYLRSLAADGR